MKFLDHTFWKFTIAFIVIIVVVLGITKYVTDYEDTTQTAPSYTAK
ncbi:MAG: hypothetical protein WC764_03135 [Candidatus Paceibacterota bacterium]|jgi:hypothetical protein